MQAATAFQSMRPDSQNEDTGRGGGGGEGSIQAKS